MACATVLDIPDPECPGHLKLCYDRVGDLANPGQNHKYTLLVSVSCYYKLVLFLLRRSGKECILHINGRDHEAVLMNVRKVTVCVGLLLGSVCSAPHPLILWVCLVFVREDWRITWECDGPTTPVSLGL